MNQSVKIIFWERDPVSYKKHKRTVDGRIIKDGFHAFVIQVGKKAIVIPHHDIIRIQEKVKKFKVENRQ